MVIIISIYSSLTFGVVFGFTRFQIALLMQDGASALWSKTVRQWLDQKLPSMWVDRQGFRGRHKHQVATKVTKILHIVISFYKDSSRLKYIILNPGISMS